MSKLIRQYDPTDTERRLSGLVIQEDVCPGLLEFLAGLQFRTEGPFLRGVLYQWYLAHQQAGDLEEAVLAVLNGPGGLIENVPSDRSRRIKPAMTKPAKRRASPTAARVAVGSAGLDIPAQLIPRSTNASVAGITSQSSSLPTQENAQSRELPSHQGAPESGDDAAQPPDAEQLAALRSFENTFG